MLRQFVRFARMEGGVFYGAITPQYPVLPLIMPHFAERFQVQPFILHDKTHGQAGVFDTREWVIASTEGLALPDSTADEAFYRRLWKTFYDTVAIKERTNYNLRRNHMPKKYWKNMVEMQPSPEELFPSRFADGGKLPETPAPRKSKDCRKGKPAEARTAEEVCLPDSLLPAPPLAVLSLWKGAVSPPLKSFQHSPGLCCPPSPAAASVPFILPIPPFLRIGENFSYGQYRPA